MTRLAQRLAFDSTRGEIRDQTRRYLMLRPDVLMGALRLLDEPARKAALDAFAASVAQHGRDSVLAYLEQLGGDRSRLLDAMQEAAADVGWGCWQFEVASGGLKLIVENSPFAVGYGGSDEAVCAPIRGMLQAVGEIVLGTQVASGERACACVGGAVCVFEAAPLDRQKGR
jgi:predicted hydrocarbon binding protein